MEDKGANLEIPDAGLHRTVKAAGWVSLLTDFSSDMIYPLLPLFLKTILNSSMAFVGLVEGAAETTASLLKLFSGRISDRLKKRKGLVLAGYALSSVSRPLMAISGTGWHVLSVRLADRIGKGIRTSPRDALVADVSAPGARGRTFGYLRAMDNTGAILGPLAAAGLLWLFRNFADWSTGFQFRLIFAIAAIPGLLAPPIIWFFIREASPSSPAQPRGHGASLSGWRGLSPDFWRFVLAVVLFTLGNSSDAFLLLRADEIGLTQRQVPLLWAFFHLVKALSSLWGGKLADRWSVKRTLLLGWTIYSLSYLFFGLASQPWQVWLIFAFYGTYYGCVEGPARAAVAGLAPAELRGTAYGIFHAATGIVALPASLLFGWIWQTTGKALLPFAFGACLAGIAAFALLRVRMGPMGSRAGSASAGKSA